MKVSVRSFTPLRARFVLDAGALSDAEARGLARALKSYEGVRSVSVHTANLSVIVTYVESLHTTAHAQVFAYLCSLHALSMPTQHEALPDHASIEFESTQEKNRFHLELCRLGLHRLLIHAITWPRSIFLAWILWHSWHFIRLGLESLRHKHLQVEVLDATVIAISIARGELASAGTIMFLLRLSDCVQRHVSARTHLSLKGGIISRSEWVWKRVDTEDVRCALANIKPHDHIHILSGAAIPVDGRVVEGVAEINEASLTGESRLVHKEAGSSVYAGCAVEAGDIVVEVLALAGEARIDKIVSMVEESSLLKARAHAKAERLSDGLVPYSFAAFFAVLLLTRRLTQALSVLMVDYSCAIKLSVPIAIASAMDEAIHEGIVVKGGKFFEAMSACNMVVFDKTGTLTCAVPKLMGVVSFCELSEDEILRRAACIEEHFPHSVARAITRAAEERGLDHSKEVHTEVEYVVAHGIKTHIGNDVVCIGSARFVFEVEGAQKPSTIDAHVREVLGCDTRNVSYIYMTQAGKLAGVLCITDPIRDEARQTIEALRAHGITRVVMLTGDSAHIAEAVAQQVGIDEYQAEVLPEDKLSYITSAQREGYTVAMVGDGINDSPALAQANVSLAMSDASDIARAVADITLKREDLRSLVYAKEISQKLMTRIHRGFVGIVGVNTSLIVLGLLGVISPIYAAYVHNGYTFALTLLNMQPVMRNQKNIQKYEK